MDRIMDIYGKMTAFENDYSQDEKWYGRVLLGQDHQFEGIIEDASKKYYYVFGQLTKESLFLTRCAVDDRKEPSVYDSVMNRRRYRGTMRTCEEQMPIGYCEMGVYSAEVTRDETKEEADEIKRGLEIIKERLGEQGKTLLQDFTESRKQANK